MFTGIVEEVGRVHSVEPRGAALVLAVDARVVTSELGIGDSVAVNGVCLTAVELDGGRVGFDVIPETLSKTSLGGLRTGDAVNLERSLLVGGRLGGHFVQGHVDDVGRVTDVSAEGEWYMLSVEAPDIIRRYLIPHGSITVEGVSLTVARINEDGFTVGLIPHTLENTNLGTKQPGDLVNLEADMLGKYVGRLLGDGGRVLDLLPLL